jgi:glycosyltransferase involved in cell wall biosynthesis
MRITFVMPFINRTGGIRVILDYANWLHDAGHLVTLVYPCWPYRFGLTHRQRLSEFRRELGSDAHVAWLDVRCRLLRVPLIRARSLPPADVVVATSWPTAIDVARLPAWCGRKVHMLMHHEGGTGPERRIRSIYQLPFYRITFSTFVRDTIQRQFGCAIDAVVPNGVDPTLFFPDRRRPDDSVLMLYHPDPRKGADEGVRALLRVRRRRPDAFVHMCGTVPPARLPDGLSFELHPDDVTLRRRYSEAAVFLYPSRYEGFGLPPLEAMACGCPVVTTSVGAVPEFAEHRRNALVVAPGDVEGMADAVEELLDQVALRHRLAARGIETAARYSLDRVAPQFATALEQAA